MLLGFAQRMIGQFVKQTVEHGVKFLVRAGSSEFACNCKHWIVLPVERRLRPSKPFAQTQKASQGWIPTNRRGSSNA